MTYDIRICLIKFTRVTLLWLQVFLSFLKKHYALFEVVNAVILTTYVHVFQIRIGLDQIFLYTVTCILRCGVYMSSRGDKLVFISDS